MKVMRKMDRRAFRGRDGGMKKRMEEDEDDEDFYRR